MNKPHRHNIIVVGRFSRTTYGPFDSEEQAQSFIRVQLSSTPRYYGTECTKCIEAARKCYTVAAWK